MSKGERIPVTLTESLRDEWQPFRAEAEPDRDIVRVVASGELDLAAAAPLREQLDELRGVGFEHVVLDLRDLTFMDIAGARVILDADAAARREGTTFELIPGPEPVQRLLDLLGISDRLRWTDNATRQGVLPGR